VIDGGQIHKRAKKASKAHREAYGHTPYRSARTCLGVAGNWSSAPGCTAAYRCCRKCIRKRRGERLNW
jgi:hypothetical protein